MPHARDNEASGKPVNAKLRAADFMQAYMDKEVDAIWCVRGGAGSIDTAKLLDWDKLRTRKLPVVGFSNITSLHCVMQKNKAGRVFSGPSLPQMLQCNERSVAWFARTMAGGKHPRSGSRLSAMVKRVPVIRRADTLHFISGHIAPAMHRQVMVK